MRNKKIHFILIVLIGLTSCVPKGKQVLLTSQIEYDVAINNYGLMDPAMAHLSNDSRGELQDFFLESVKNGNAIDSMGEPISAKILAERIKRWDSTFKDVKDETALQHFFKNINGLRFSEKWVYNDKTLAIDKKVISISPLVIEMDTFGTWMSLNLLFTVALDTANEVDPQSPVLSEFIITDSYVKNNNPLLEELYNKKMSDQFSNIEVKSQDAYMSLFLTKVKNKDSKAYDFYFKEINAGEKLKALQVELRDPETDKVTIYDLKPADFWRIKFAEKWTFNSAKKQFKKEVYAINPAVMVVDEYDNVRGFKPVFWYLFDEKVLEIARKSGF